MVVVIIVLLLCLVWLVPLDQNLKYGQILGKIFAEGQQKKGKCGV